MPGNGRRRTAVELLHFIHSLTYVKNRLFNNQRKIIVIDISRDFKRLLNNLIDN